MTLDHFEKKNNMQTFLCHVTIFLLARCRICQIWGEEKSERAKGSGRRKVKSLPHYLPLGLRGRSRRTINKSYIFPLIPLRIVWRLCIQKIKLPLLTDSCYYAHKIAVSMASVPLKGISK